MVDCWKCWSLHNMHSSENMRRWQLVYEADSYSLCSSAVVHWVLLWLTSSHAHSFVFHSRSGKRHIPSSQHLFFDLHIIGPKISHVAERTLLNVWCSVRRPKVKRIPTVLSPSYRAPNKYVLMYIRVTFDIYVFVFILALPVGNVHSLPWLEERKLTYSEI
jgi:hypothetical protein